jgi:hypothetical protein
MLLFLYSYLSLYVYLVILYLLLLLINGGIKKKQEPELIRGKIPYLGVGFELGYYGLYNFIKKCEEYYGRVYTLYAVGNRFTIISDPALFSQVFKNTDAFSFKQLKEEMGSKITGKPKTETITGMTSESMIIKYFGPGEDLKKITQDFEGYAKKMVFGMFKDGQKEVKVSLQKMIRKVLFESSSKSIIGESFNSEKCEEDYFFFDDNLQLLISGLPTFLFQKQLNARDRIFEEIRKVPTEEYCKFFRDKVKITKEEDLKYIPNELFSILNASQTNTINGGFWNFYFVMKNEKIKEKLMKEIEELYDPEDYACLDNMHYLEAIFNESNRFLKIIKKDLQI